ncbi:MAG TPA: dipeptidase [Pirellulales bacterium]|nr:dipeptidase [Pirellulales bacterium]
MPYASRESSRLRIPRAAARLPSLVLAIAITALPGGAQAQQPPSKPDLPPIKLTDEALRIHRAGLLIDGHNDLPWRLRSDFGASLEKCDITKRHAPNELQTDIPRLRQGGVGGQFWSVYVPAETRQAGTALRDTLEQIDLVRQIVARYPETFELALTAADVERIRGQGKIASLIGVEGGHSIQDSIGALRQLYRLGARYMTLTHSDTLSWADSATDVAKHGGLSPFGEEVVREMNRLGMLVDISHVSPETMQDALRVSRAPVIASHSSAYAIAQHARNVPDDVLKLVAANGGVVMVNFFSGFVEPQSARIMADMFAVRRQFNLDFNNDDAQVEAAMKRWRQEHPILPGTVHTVVDHIDHIVKVAGIDHVGLGSDFDGVSMTPVQLEDVSCYPYITQELLDRGYGEEQIHKILGRNVLRALRQAEDVARGE